MQKKWFLLVLLIVMFPFLGITGYNVFFVDGSEQWFAMNGGQPIFSNWGDVEAISNSEAVYAIIDDGEDFYATRFNFSMNKWETLSSNGWSSEENPIPIPLSITESIRKIKLFSIQNQIRGFFIGYSKILPKNLDVHGAIFDFYLNDSIKKWTGNGYDEFSSQTLFYSWNGVTGEMAIDDRGNSLAVGSYGYTLGGGVLSITAAKFINDTWKLWNGSGWTNWHSSYNSYTPIIQNNETSLGITNPKISFLNNTKEFIGFYNRGNKLCSFKYNDTWFFWSDIGWTNDSSLNCSEFNSLLPGYRADGYYSYNNILSNNTNIFLISNNITAINYLSYSSDGQWSSGHILDRGDLLSYAINIDKNGQLAYVTNPLSDSSNISLHRNEGVSKFSVPYPAAIEKIIFLEDNTPMIFISMNASLYVYSSKDFNDTLINKTIIIPEAKPIDSSFVINKTWIDRVNEVFYGASLAGHLALDSEENIYSPHVGVCSLLIFHKDKDPLTQGNFWGGFWDYFWFPSGVDVDNVRERVYVADYLAGTGGSGGLYSGRVIIFNKSFNNQTLFYKTLGVSPNLPKPEIIYPVTMYGFKFPSDLAIDEENGYLYVSDSMNHKIVKYDVINLESDTPVKLSEIGSFGTGEGEFKFPLGIDTDELGNLYVADSGNHRIQKFDKNGTFNLSFGDFGKGHGQFMYPYSLSVDNVYNLIYVADPYNKNFQIFSKNGTFIKRVNSEGVLNFSAVGGISGNNGTIHLGYFALTYMIAKIEIANKTDLNLNLIPDSLEICRADGCNQNCPGFCTYPEDLDCGGFCNDQCKNGDEVITDCGGSCNLISEEQCSDGIDNDCDGSVDEGCSSGGGGSSSSGGGGWVSNLYKLGENVASRILGNKENDSIDSDTSERINNLEYNFSLNGEEHSIIILNFSNSSVILEIRSESIIVELFRSQPKQIDVDKDGKDDIIIEYNDFIDGKIDLRVSIIDQKNVYEWVIFFICLATIATLIILFFVYRKLKKEEGKEEKLKSKLRSFS
ncbi:MAG: NHL repeat-containing protein [Nanoarchaeota archaeon]